MGGSPHSNFTRRLCLSLCWMSVYLQKHLQTRREKGSVFNISENSKTVVSTFLLENGLMFIKEASIKTLESRKKESIVLCSSHYSNVRENNFLIPPLFFYLKAFETFCICCVCGFTSLSSLRHYPVLVSVIFTNCMTSCGGDMPLCV